MNENGKKFMEGVKAMDEMAGEKTYAIDKAGYLWFNFGIKILKRDAKETKILDKYSFADAVQNTLGDLEKASTDEEYSELLNWLIDEIYRQVDEIHEIVNNNFKDYDWIWA